MVFEKTLEHPLDCKEIKPVHPKGDQSWILIGRTDAKAETPILWPPDVKNWKRPWCWERLKAGGDRRWGWQEDEMVGWLHRLSGHEFEQAPGADDGQGSLACCSPWYRKESDTTQRLNWAELNAFLLLNTQLKGLLYFLAVPSTFFVLLKTSLSCLLFLLLLLLSASWAQKFPA